MWKGADVILAVPELGNILLATNANVKSRVQQKKYVIKKLRNVFARLMLRVNCVINVNKDILIFSRKTKMVVVNVSVLGKPPYVTVMTDLIGHKLNSWKIGD